jgi:hypothetical protein
MTVSDWDEPEMNLDVSCRRPRRAASWWVKALFASLASVSLVATLGTASPARGSLAGKVFDKKTGALVPGVEIGANALTSGEELHTVTNASGGYYVASAPTGVYAFTLNVDGIDYVVQERFDVRVAMPFLLESCFELDRERRSAHVRVECDSGFVEEARVATIGPHRFLRPSAAQDSLPGEAVPPVPEIPQSPAEPSSSDIVDPVAETPEDSDELASESSMAAPETILHDELECLTYDHFPIVDARIAPGDKVQVSRVYFRSDKYPDFYYVDMGHENPTPDDFRAILPKPSLETERIYYYVESVDDGYNSLQTLQHDPQVLEVQACKDRGAVWFQGEDPNIVVGATTGLAAALPPGFQAAGITGFVSSLGVLTTVGGAAAAGGGVASTTGLVLVVAGGTAAAAGTTVAVTGDKEASPP